MNQNIHDVPTDWTLIYKEWDPKLQPLREALCTLGNGYFATRGAAEEAKADGPHYPGTYLAGGYNRLESEVAGRVIENEDLVNWPNWLCLSFRIENGPWLDLSAVELLDFQQSLDLRRGVLEHECGCGTMRTAKPRWSAGVWCTWPLRIWRRSSGC